MMQLPADPFSAACPVTKHDIPRVQILLPFKSIGQEWNLLFFVTISAIFNGSSRVLGISTTVKVVQTLPSSVCRTFPSFENWKTRYLLNCSLFFSPASSNQYFTFCLQKCKWFWYSLKVELCRVFVLWLAYFILHET